MSIKAMTACLVTAAVLMPAGRSFGEAGSIPELKRVDNSEDVARVVDLVKGMIGNDFVLDHFQDEPRTLEDGFKYVVTESRANLIRNALNQAKTVYGVDGSSQSGGETVRVFVFSASPEFTDDLVYAVSTGAGYPWSIFRHRKR